MNDRLYGKYLYLKESILTTGIPNALINGIIYYFLNKNNEKIAFEFWINGAITSFLLALICGACLTPALDKRIKEGKLKADSYTRDNHIIGYMMPKSFFSQLMVVAILVTAQFIFVSAAIPVIFGYVNKPIPALNGAVLHGIQCGAMGINTVYYMMVARCVNSNG